jgi:pantoate--beta-alanine ligase
LALRRHFATPSRRAKPFGAWRVNEMGQVPVVRTVKGLRKLVDGWRAEGLKVALVPTMGALHAGHISLVTQARRRADKVIVSIFVNPTQFAPNEDFSKYPRTFADDRKQLTVAKADLIFAPTVPEMYPNGFTTTVSLAGPASVGLEDRFRPTHFAGVATIVCKLFTQARPHLALFGEKDYQQLQVITRMARDLDLDVKVIGCATIREPDGLAMSSRNRYLAPQDRETALTLYREMTAAAARIRGGTPIETALGPARAAITAAGFALDYLEVRDAASLMPVSAPPFGPLRILVAARIGQTRLIDNIAV